MRDAGDPEGRGGGRDARGMNELTSRGNLSQRSLLDVVNKEDMVENSEFLETLLVAVPK